MVIFHSYVSLAEGNQNRYGTIVIAYQTCCQSWMAPIKNSYGMFY